jgi:hypothetical protein
VFVQEGEWIVVDIILVASTVLFFLVSFALVRWFDRI